MHFGQLLAVVIGVILVLSHMCKEKKRVVQVSLAVLSVFIFVTGLGLQGREVATDTVVQFIKAGSEQSFAELKELRADFAEEVVSGERFVVPREGADGVETIIYRPKEPGKEPLPVIFNMHGGAWIGGDAVLMDAFCSDLANRLPAVVVNINYKKADVHLLPYPQFEVADTVLYFAEHADEYGVDPAKFAVSGYSAGGNIAAGAAVRLKELGFNLAAQVLNYAFVDFNKKTGNFMQDVSIKVAKQLFMSKDNSAKRYISPMEASKGEITGVAPAIIIIAGEDTLKPQNLAYANKLMNVEVPVSVKIFPGTYHGFMELDKSGDTDQLAIANDCADYMINELRAYFR